MPSNLSPSREAVQAARHADDVLQDRETFDEHITRMLAAAYAVDCAPLVEALEGFRYPGPDACFCGSVNDDVHTERCILARAVLARSQEPHKETP